MIYLLLAEGFEEVEALCPLDILRRGGCDVKTVGITGKTVTGAHGIPVVADLLPEEATDAMEMLILPGGMPGTTNLDASPATDRLLRKAEECGARIAAICAAPSVLGRRGLLAGKRAVCYPGFEKELRGAIPATEHVVTDGRITTAIGMGAAAAFGLELLTLLTDAACARRIAASSFLA